MKLTQQHFVSFFKDTFIVVIGVLIAVFINNFNEQRTNQQYIKQTLHSIQQEIVQNKAEVDTVMKKHFVLLDSIQTSIKNEEESISQLIGRLGGIQSASIKNVGLRFFIANKAELVDYKLIAQLLEIETSTELLDKKTDKLIDFTFENIEQKDEITKLKLRAYLSNMIDSEFALLELYGEYLEQDKMDKVHKN